MDIQIAQMAETVYQAALEVTYSNIPIILGTEDLRKPFEHFQSRGMGWRCLEGAVCLTQQMIESGVETTFHKGEVGLRGWEHYVPIAHCGEKRYLCDVGMLVDMPIEIPPVGEEQTTKLSSKVVKVASDQDKLRVYFGLAGGSPRFLYQIFLTPAEIPSDGELISENLRLLRLVDGKIHSLDYNSRGRVVTRIIDSESEKRVPLTSLDQVADEFAVDLAKLLEANAVLEKKGGRPIIFH